MYVYHIDENPNSLVSSLAADLQWKTEPPTEPGMYRWFFENIGGGKDGGRSWAVWKEVRKDGTFLVVDLYDDTEFLDESIETAKRDGYKIQWLGPIPVPIPPK